MYRLLLSLSLFSSCGSAVLIDGDPLAAAYAAYEHSAEVSTSYDPPCLGAVVSELPIRRFTILEDLMLARNLLDRVGIVPADEFCVAYEGTAVYVQRFTSLEDEHRFGGQYSTFRGIDLGVCGEALLHELLHLWDWQHAAPGTFVHEGWDENGYYEATREFQSRMTLWCERDV